MRIRPGAILPSPDAAAAAAFSFSCFKLNSLIIATLNRRLLLAGRVRGHARIRFLARAFRSIKNLEGAMKLIYPKHFALSRT
jgi:hypothetical protein